MKTLQEIKDEFALSQGEDSFKNLVFSKLLSSKNGILGAYELIDYLVSNISIESQKECLNRANDVFLNNDVGDTLDFDLLRSELNIVK